MTLIDSHCHLYLEDFTEDINAIMQRADTQGVKKFYMPAIDSKETDRLLSMEKKFPGKCFAMMGLHPCSVKENYKTELRLVEDWLAKRKFAAVGETGLDFYWDKTFIAEQYDALRMQIEWGIQYDLPVV